MKSIVYTTTDTLSTTRLQVFSKEIARVLIVQIASLLFLVIGSLIFWWLELGNDWQIAAVVTGITFLFTVTVMSVFWSLFDLRTLRLPGMFVASYLVMVILPTPVIYAAHPTPFRNTYLWATMISFICTIGGVITVSLVSPQSGLSIKKWLLKANQISSSVKFLFILLSCICFGILFLYISTIGVLPIQQALAINSSAQELAQAREDSLKLISGRIVHIFLLLRSVLFPYVMMLSVVIAYISGKKFWLIMSAVIIAGNFVMASATLEKSPLAASCIVLSFTWLLLRRKPISLKRIFWLGAIACSFPIFIMALIYQFDRGIQEIINLFLYRLLIIPSDVLYFHFEYFPQHEDFLLGRTLPSIGKLIPGGTFPVANIVCLYMLPDIVIRSCSANAAYPGTLWADFGWIGILGGSFIVGIFIQTLQVLTQELPKSGPTIVLQAFLAFQVIFLTSASLPDAIFSNGMGYATLLTIFLSFTLSKAFHPMRSAS